MTITDPLIEAAMYEDAFPIAIGRSCVSGTQAARLDIEPVVYDKFVRVCAAQGLAKKTIVESLICEWMAAQQTEQPAAV